MSSLCNRWIRFFYLCSAFLACTSPLEISNGADLEKLKLEETTPQVEGSIVLDRQSGTVAYWPHSGQWAVDFFAEGTIDSINTGLVQELDEEFQKPASSEYSGQSGSISKRRFMVWI